MKILINLVLFYLTFSYAQVECSTTKFTALRKLSDAVGSTAIPPAVTAVGADACDKLLNSLTRLGAPWCACFRWPEAVNLITNETAYPADDGTYKYFFDDCRFSIDVTEIHANFEVRQAVHWCDEDTPCANVTQHSVCVAKNCFWNDITEICSDQAPSCADVPDENDPLETQLSDCRANNACLFNATGNEECSDDTSLTERRNNDTMVANAALGLEVPWIDGCDMLVAVYDRYHSRKCDDVIYEMKTQLVLNGWEVDTVFNTTLRDICGETCWYQDQGAPYVFDRDHHCSQHSDCNNGNENVHDFFCADCAKCMANYKNAPTTNECGICSLTKYDTDVCIEMQQCTTEKSIDGVCASQTETLPEDATTGNERCAAEDTYKNIRIDSCFAYFDNLDNDETIRTNACPCHLDDDFIAFDCAWDLQFIYTLAEVKDFCKMPCDQIMDRDACLSAHQNNADETNCVWLDRLVKGKCVDDPCASDAGRAFCNHDSCVKCSTDAMGEQSCIVNFENEGLPCDDKDSETDNDVCGTELYGKNYDGADRVFACKGNSAVEKLEEEKSLCVDGKGWTDCCVGGEVYRCANEVLNYTRYRDGDCNKEPIATYYWLMNGNCSNVITTEARSRNIYFGGLCNEVDGTAQARTCSEEEYWAWLASQTPEFIPFDDSASTLGILSIISLLLFFFI